VQLGGLLAAAPAAWVAAYLFGSQARGRARPGSDVDLPVLREYRRSADRGAH